MVTLTEEKCKPNEADFLIVRENRLSYVPYEKPRMPAGNQAPFPLFRMPPVRIELNNESEDEEREREEEPEETSQSWLASQLLSFGLEAAAVAELVNGDISEFIRFLTATDPGRILFVLIERKPQTMPLTIATLAVYDETSKEPPADNKSSDAIISDVETDKPARKNIKQMRASRKQPEDGRSKTRSQNTKRSGTSSPAKHKSPKTPESKKKGKEMTSKSMEEGEERTKSRGALRITNQQKLPELLKTGGSSENKVEPQVQKETMTKLTFSSICNVPKSSKQFVYIIPRTKELEYEKNEFDRLYDLGFLRSRAQLDASLSVVSMLLADLFTPQASLDLLFIHCASGERRQPEEWTLQRFVTETIGAFHSTDGRGAVLQQRATDDTDVSEFTESRGAALLITPVLNEFALKPNSSSVARVQLQLSFFDIDYIVEERCSTVVAVRLEHALRILMILHSLFGREIGEWLSRFFRYLLDLFATIFAKLISRKASLVLSFGSELEGEVENVCETFQSFISEVRECADRFVDKDNERNVAEKLAFSFNVVSILEEGIDELFEVIRFVRDSKHDMAVDRQPLDEAERVIKETADILQENCLESVVEGGSLESLRGIVNTLDGQNEKIQNILANFA